MSSTKTSTPIKQQQKAVDSPGNWRHPRLAEIERRKEQSTFNDNNLRIIVGNICALILLWATHTLVRWLGFSLRFVTLPQCTARFQGSLHGPGADSTPCLSSKNDPLRWYLLWGYRAVQLVPAFNIGFAVLPLWRKPDDLADIPLTPGQRRLLGLAPVPANPAAARQVSTPPRYSRTPSVAGATAGSAFSTPNSTRASPGGSVASLPGSPYSPAASPLLHKGGAGVLQRQRRASSIGGSPLGGGNGGGTLAAILGNAGSPAGGLLLGADNGGGSPSPASAGKRSSIGLNSKWLYEKGRRTSGGSWAF